MCMCVCVPCATYVWVRVGAYEPKSALFRFVRALRARLCMCVSLCVNEKSENKCVTWLSLTSSLAIDGLSFGCVSVCMCTCTTSFHTNRHTHTYDERDGSDTTDDGDDVHGEAERVRDRKESQSRTHRRTHIAFSIRINKRPKLKYKQIRFYCCLWTWNEFCFCNARATIAISSWEWIAWIDFFSLFRCGHCSVLRLRVEYPTDELLLLLSFLVLPAAVDDGRVTCRSISATFIDSKNKNTQHETEETKSSLNEYVNLTTIYLSRFLSLSFSSSVKKTNALFPSGEWWMTVCVCVVLWYDIWCVQFSWFDVKWATSGLPWIFGWFYCRSKFRKTLIGCDFVIRFTGILSPPGPFLTPSPSPSIPASPRLHPSPSQSPFHSDVILITNSTNSDTVSGESCNFIWRQPFAGWRS